MGRHYTCNPDATSWLVYSLLKQRADPLQREGVGLWFAVKRFRS